MRRRRSWPSTIRRILFDVITLAGFAARSRAQLAAGWLNRTWRSRRVRGQFQRTEAGFG
jgi:hypothetical protein